MKRYLPFVIVSAVALITLAGGTMLYRTKGLPLLTISKDHVAPGTDGAGSIHIRGQPDAPVTLEEFGDFECPPCGKLSEPINQLEHDYHSRFAACIAQRGGSARGHRSRDQGEIAALIVFAHKGKPK